MGSHHKEADTTDNPRPSPSHHHCFAGRRATANQQ
nr:MAG TPA: hypothetical protein [Caudoviricetes sp.]